MKKLIVAAIAGISFAPAFALTTYELATTVHDTVVDWSSGDSYKGGEAPTDFSDACIVIDQITVKVDASNFGDFAKIAEINFKNGDASKCIVDTDAADLETPGSFYGDGWLIKKGTGKLTLVSTGRIVSATGSTDNDRYCSIDVLEGTLDDGASRASGITKAQIRKLNIAADATFVLAKNVETWVNRELSGAGTVTSPEGADVNATKFMPRYAAVPQEFSGVIDTNVRLYCCANLTLSGTNSLMNGAHIIDGGSTLAQYDGFLSLKKFGLGGQPSSLGKARAFSLQEGGGRMRYVGNAPDECDKEIKLIHSSATTADVQGVIDGGPYGALTLSGWIHPDSYRNNQRLWLGGSNVNECVLSGSITSKVYDNGKAGDARIITTNRIHVTKTGTGAWHFKENVDRDGINGVTVKNGTLVFDTIAEAGEHCVFGSGRLFPGVNAFYGDWCEMFDPARVTPNFFTLGDVDDATAVGLLKPNTTWSATCETRPAVVAGKGGFANDNSSVRFAFTGVSSSGTGSKTLVLDGSSTAENTVFDVTETANAPLAVEKRGTGSWTLSGNQAFTGGIAVKGGELKLDTRSGGSFNWFRLVLKENWHEYTYGALCDYWAKYVFLFNSKGFALYDVDGSNLAANCVDAVDYSLLREGEVAYKNETRTSQDYGKGVSFGQMLLGKDRWVGGLSTPYLSKPETWVTLDFRLPVNSRAVAVDFKPQYGYDHKQIPDWNRRNEIDSSCWNYSANVKYFTMYGSTDGIHWEPLFDNDVYCEGTNYTPSVWYFGDNYSQGAAKGLKFDHTTSSRPAATVLPNVGTVSVSNGGVLRIEGDPISVASLEVDPLSGGTISNVTFAAEGTLVVREIPEGRDITLPGTYQDVTGFENIAESWTLDAGSKSKSYQIVDRNGELHLLKRGLMLIVR